MKITISSFDLFGALRDFLPDECRSDVLHACNNCSAIGYKRIYAALHIQCILYISVFLNVIDVNFIQVNTMNGLRRFYVNIQLSWIYFNLSLSLSLCLSLYPSLCLLLSLSISFSHSFPFHPTISMNNGNWYTGTWHFEKLSDDRKKGGNRLSLQ